MTKFTFFDIHVIDSDVTLHPAARHKSSIGSQSTNYSNARLKNRVHMLADTYS